MPDLTNFLRCLDDKFTPVRDTSGRLLGCVPRVPDNADVLFDSARRAFELRVAAQVCVCVDLSTQSPTTLEGFMPLDDTQADLAVPAVPPEIDLAEGV